LQLQASMKHTKGYSKIKAKCFYAVASLMTAMLVVLYPVAPNLEPKESIQLSSTSTSMSDIEEYYDLQIRLLKDQTVMLDSSKKKIALKRGTLITVTAPRSAFGKVSDPKKINVNQVLMLLKRQTKDSGLETIIRESPDNLALIGETAHVSANRLTRGGTARLESIEKSEDFVDDADYVNKDLVGEDVYAQLEAAICPSGTCGGAPQRVEQTNALNNIIDNIVDRFSGSFSPPPKSWEEVIENHENSDQTKKLMNAIDKGYSVAIRRKGRIIRRAHVKDGRVSPSYKYCLAGVKTALQIGGVVDRYLPGSAAQGSGPTLERSGFVNLLKTDYKDKIKSPYDAPLGSVIVYSGGRYGHVEIKTDQGFISDYFSKNARTGSAASGLNGAGRKVIGVYIKSDSTIQNHLAQLDKGSKGSKQ
jgi:hypothetical protein